MEYLQGMDLFDFIRKDSKFFMSNPKIFWVVVESILRGLAYLHSKGIAHMDIKPENVFLLLDDKGNIVGVKLIDLGLAIDITKKKKCIHGTDAYMGPEFFHFCWTTGLPADIWSLGITAFVMLRGYLPISSRNKDRQEAKKSIFSKIASLLSTISFNPFFKRSENAEIFEIEAFILSCLITDPENRLTADDLLKTIPVSTPQISL
jgi:serine/threonine protein kinase